MARWSRLSDRFVGIADRIRGAMDHRLRMPEAFARLDRGHLEARRAELLADAAMGKDVKKELAEIDKAVALAPSEPTPYLDRSRALYQRFWIFRIIS